MPREKRVDAKGILLISLFVTVCLLSGSALLAQGSITFTPSSPNVEEPVSFTLTPPGRFSGTVQWDFGDKSTASGGTTISHKYLSAGSFAVKATVTIGGRPNTTQTKVAIIEKRKVSFKPTAPKPGDNIAFQARDFLTSSIKWDFGDGTIKTSGPEATHAYSRSGTFTVKAADLRGTSCCPVAISVTVAAAAAPQDFPSVPLRISSLQLRFEDGKAYTQVPRNFTPLISFVDISYEGSGNFEAQWLLDGKPFKTVYLSFPSGRVQTIDSGAAFPTRVPGAYEITFRITKPQVPFTPPTIRYLVVTEGTEEQVALGIAEARDLETRGLIVIDEDRLVLSPGRKYLLKGTIKNISGQVIPNALVFITLAGKGLDQKRFANLAPGETRTFETSFLNETGLPRWLILEAFETAAKEKLLTRRTFTLQGEGIQLPKPPSRPLPALGVPSTPIISSLSPESVEAGSGAIDPLTINGSDFDTEGAVVRVRVAGEMGTGTNYTPTSIAEAQILVVIPESWTSEIKSLEIRVQNPDGSGGWVNSDWFPFQVIIGKITAKLPPRVPDIEAKGPVITGLNPASYYQGGPIHPLVIEGKNFIKPELENQALMVKVREGNKPETAIFLGYVHDHTDTISATRIECDMPDRLTLNGNDLEIIVAIGGHEGTEMKEYESAPAALPCLGIIPRITTLYPDRIRVGTVNLLLQISAPNSPDWMNCFVTDQYQGNTLGSTVVKIKSTDDPGTEEILTAACLGCEASEAQHVDLLWLLIPPQWMSTVRDLEVQAGNPDGNGGFIWGNSLILPVVPEDYTVPLGTYPETEIVRADAPTTPQVPSRIHFRAIEGQDEIMGFEYGIAAHESDFVGNVRWLENYETSADLSGLVFGDDGSYDFCVRAIDIHGRRDPSWARHTFKVDHHAGLNISLTQLRVDDDGDPPGQKGEVYFGHYILIGEDEEKHCHVFFPDADSCDAICDLYQPGLGFYTFFPPTAGNYMFPIWKMDSGETKFLDIGCLQDIYCDPRNPETRFHLVAWGWEFDCGGPVGAVPPAKRRMDSLGAMVITLRIRSYGSEYKISSDGINWTSLNALSEGGSAFQGNSYSAINFEAEPDTGGEPVQVPRVGGFTLFYRIERIN